MSDKIKIAVVGYGNVGRGVISAVELNDKYSGDMEVVGIISRRPEDVRKQVNNYEVFSNEGRGLWRGLEADVAVLCGGSKTDLPEQGPFFAQFIPTVDSFDNHNNIPEYFKQMDEIAREAGHASIISAGWDPGTFSIERILANAFIPGANAHGFYGLTEEGGLSQGHSDAVRRIKGVADARQYTHASEVAIDRVRAGENPDLSKGDMHWREVKVVLQNDTSAERERVTEEIVTDKDYFAPYHTEVEFVTQKEIDNNYSQMPHDGKVISVGETGNGNRCSIEYGNEWASNPEGTGQILAACARACYKLNQKDEVGAYTMADLSPALLSPHSREELLRDFM
jgi:diaminopimelate dehydrogenase